MTESAAKTVAWYSIGVDHSITPDESLLPLPEISKRALVVIEGRAPIWRYGMVLYKLQGSLTGAIALFDPRLGAVVVASHRPKFREGQILDVTPQGNETKP